MRLEDMNFNGTSECEYNKTPTAQESINTIYRILGVQERIKEWNTYLR